MYWCDSSKQNYGLESFLGTDNSCKFCKILRVFTSFCKFLQVFTSFCKLLQVLQVLWEKNHICANASLASSGKYGTIKPVYNNHPWHLKNVVIMQRAAWKKSVVTEICACIQAPKFKILQLPCKLCEFYICLANFVQI